MRVISVNENRAELNFEANEILAIGNALNEVCHGIDLPEFQTRLGVEREFVQALLKSISAVAEKLTFE